MLCRLLQVGFFVGLMAFYSCTSAQRPAPTKATDSDGGGTTTSGGGATDTLTSENFSFASEPPHIVLQRGANHTDAVLQLSGNSVGAVYSFDPALSDCDEHPWSETFAMSPDGTLVGHATQEGTCSLLVYVTKGDVTLSHTMNLEIEGCSPQTQTLTISDNGDDGYLRAGADVDSPGDNVIWSGAWDEAEQFGYFRFALDEALPPGSIVTSARLDVYGRSGSGNFDTGKSLRIYSNLSEDARQPSVAHSPYSNDPIALSSGYQLWTATTTSDWQIGAWNQSPDISSIIQETIDHTTDGIASGEHVMVLMGPNHGTEDLDVGVEDYNASESNHATLTIEWDQCHVANAKPSIGITAPTVLQRYEVGETIDISWVDSDTDDDANISLYLVPEGVTSSCTSGTLIHNGLSEDATTDTYQWMLPSAMASGEYRICAIISDSSSSTTSLGQKFLVGRDCERTTGGTDFYSAAQWANCGGAAPTPGDNISFQDSSSIVVTSGEYPTVWSIKGAGTASGSSLQLNEGSMFYITSGQIQANITLTGGSNCTQCMLSSRRDIVVSNGATLTMGQHARLALADEKIVYFGDGTTTGNLYTNVATQSEWPEIMAINQWMRFNGIRIQGTSTTDALININGLYVHGHSWWNEGLKTIGYVNYTSLSNLHFDGETWYRGDPEFFVEDCTGVTFPSIWTNIIMEDFQVSWSSIDVSDCPGTMSATISGDASKPGYGSSVANDPNGVLTFTDDSQMDCTWTGAVNSNWSNAGNWNCANGRNGYPDMNNNIVITGNATIIVDQNVAFASLPTNGLHTLTLQFNDGVYAVGGGSTYDLMLRTNLTLTTTSGGECANDACGLYARGDVYVINGRTLTLGPGARLIMNNEFLRIGDGFDHGHLRTTGSPASYNDWPQIGGFQSWSNGGAIIVNGVDAANRSTVDVSELHMRWMYSSIGLVDLRDHYDIQGFSDVVFSRYYNNDPIRYISIDNCETNLFSLPSTHWSGLDFSASVDTGAGGYNVDATSCTTQTLTFSQRSGGTNAGYGASNAVDPNGMLTFNP